MTGPILFVHPSDEGYGADRVLVEMVAASLEAGRRVKVLLPDDSAPGWLSTRLRDLGVSVVKGPLAVARRRYLNLATLPRYLIQVFRARSFIRRSAKRLNASVIHINTSAVVAGALIGHPGGARTVWYVLEILVRPRALAWLFRTIPRAGDKVVVTSQAVHRHLGIREAEVIYNGVEEESSQFAPELSWLESPVVSYVGRLSAWKGYLVFLKAAIQLAPLFPDVTFVIAGSPPPGEEWRDSDLLGQIESSGLTRRVHALGFIDNSLALLERSDIVAVPSVYPDPMPTIVLQAMRAGCAIVGTAHGGIPEMIEHERSGLLVPPDDANELSDAIARLLEDQSLRERLSQAARQRVESRFTTQGFRQAMVRVYRELES